MAHCHHEGCNTANTLETDLKDEFVMSPSFKKPKYLIISTKTIVEIAMIFFFLLFIAQEALCFYGGLPGYDFEARIREDINFSSKSI